MKYSNDLKDDILVLDVGSFFSFYQIVSYSSGEH